MRVLTYNCCALPYFSGDIPDRLERIGAGLAELDPDVIVLQEIFFQKHLALVHAHLPEHAVFSPREPWKTFGGGLVVFSRFPLVDPSYAPYREQGSYLRYTVLARLSQKGIVSVRVEPPGQPAFDLIATHPVADYHAWREEEGAEAPTPREESLVRRLWRQAAAARGDPYPALQASQLTQLEEHLAQLGERPLLVLGDLNVTPDSEIFQGLLTRAGLADSMAGTSEPSLLAGSFYRLYDEVARRLDYVLHRGGFQVESARYVFTEPQELPSGLVTLSDHFGVLVELNAP